MLAQFTFHVTQLSVPLSYSIIITEEFLAKTEIKTKTDYEQQ
jgi:hypothetical protein